MTTADRPKGDIFIMVKVVVIKSPKFLKPVLKKVFKV